MYMYTVKWMNTNSLGMCLCVCVHAQGILKRWSDLKAKMNVICILWNNHFKAAAKTDRTVWQSSHQNLLINCLVLQFSHQEHDSKLYILEIHYRNARQNSKIIWKQKSLDHYALFYEYNEYHHNNRLWPKFFTRKNLIWEHGIYKYITNNPVHKGWTPHSVVGKHAGFIRHCFDQG